jgi:hypothetical protein
LILPTRTKLTTKHTFDKTQYQTHDQYTECLLSFQISKTAGGAVLEIINLLVCSTTLSPARTRRDTFGPLGDRAAGEVERRHKRLAVIRTEKAKGCAKLTSDIIRFMLQCANRP